MKYYGIADAHGLESFVPVTFNTETDGFEVDPRELSMMVLRANANRHRHAVVYQANLPIPVCKEINELLKASKYDEALTKLKEGATDIRLARSPGAEKSWKLIPNPDLDPYS
jgi:hypothetical protein